MCADIHDGREQNAPFKGANTDEPDQLSPDRHIRLATHGRSIQMCHPSDCAIQVTFAARLTYYPRTSTVNLSLFCRTATLLKGPGHRGPLFRLTCAPGRAGDI